MKKSEAEKDFTDLIKDTLDRYEEQYILGSWEGFVERRKRRKRIMLWITITGVAATLLMGWFGFRSLLSVTTGKIYNQLVINNNQTGSEDETIMRPVIIYRSQPVSSVQKNRNDHNPGIPIAGTIITGPDHQQDVVVPVINITPGKEASFQQVAIGHLSVSPDAHREDNFIALSSTVPLSNEQPESFPEDPGIIPITNVSENVRPHKLRIGFNISPGLISTSTSSSASYSAGINADYSLATKFRLSTGLQIERHNVINKNTDSPAWIPQGQTAVAVTDLDLPLNLTWKFLARKSTSYYISSGLSSVVYLAEKVTRTTYMQKMVQDVKQMNGSPNITYSLETVKMTEQSTEAPENIFDFAGRFNLIFGFEHRLSSGVNLQFEPFVKIPISLISTRDLIFTTSGLTCKISF